MNNTQEKIVKDYKQKSDAILQKMIKVLIRAQRKIDDKAYRKILKKIEAEKE